MDGAVAIAVGGGGLRDELAKTEGARHVGVSACIQRHDSDGSVKSGNGGCLERDLHEAMGETCVKTILAPRVPRPNKLARERKLSVP